MRYSSLNEIANPGYSGAVISQRFSVGMMIRVFIFLWVVLFSGGSGWAEGPTVNGSRPAVLSAGSLDSETWVEIDKAQIDTNAITDRGRQILGLPDIEWKHAQTEHFVIHYEQAIFARKVARMAEFFYSYIAQDLQGAKDNVVGRSHIFIFRSEKRWKEFSTAAGDVPDWTFSQVEGTAMFLQQAENTSSSGDVLAHETTHLVINRFFEKRCPLWLNEGLAEYYRVFAYSAYKGVKKSKRAQFGRLANPFPLEELLYTQLYPRNDAGVESFYATAQCFVAFLLLEHQSEAFMPFVEDLMSGADVKQALSKHYGLESMDDIQKQFKKFAY
jgi:hypothetical protein